MRILALALSLAGCAAATPAPDVLGPAPARLLADRKGLRLPLVRVRLHGKETLAIVDSGADAHVLASWLVAALPIATHASTNETLDPSGRSRPVREAELPFEIDGLGNWPHERVIVVDLPEAFRLLSIGLIISPQRLAGEGGALVMDFPSFTLWQEPEERALARLGEDGRRLPEPRRCNGVRREDRPLFIIDASIDGQPIRLTLDTGADATLLTTASPVARELLRAYKTTTDAAWSAGGELVTRRTPPLDLHAGGVHVLRSIPILSREAPASCGEDGQLGLDVLRRCMVVVSASRAGARCPSL
jgi:hypothetical protein